MSTTLNKRYFARNADGSIKTKQPCQTPGCKYPNWHLCFGPTSPYGPISVGGAENFLEKFDRQPERREKIRAAAALTNARKKKLENERNFERDEMVLRDHDKGYSKKSLGRKYGINHRRVVDILARREEFVAP